MDRRRFANLGAQAVAAIAAATALPRRILARGTLPTLPTDLALTKLTFGSCNRTHHDQSFWQTIANEKADLWISLGDNIYADGLSMAQRQKLYWDLKTNQHYEDFCKQIPVLGTWDDHDFASNNMGGEFADKALSKSLFLEFFNLHPGSYADREGIYQSYTFGTPGRRTKIVLLDLRYNMDRVRSERQLLGEDQWRWLHREVADNSYELLILGSSLALTSNLIGLGIEGWAAFGAERRRLLDLVAAVDKPTLVISGDRHQADISTIELPNGKLLYEFMSSGLTHSTPIYLPHDSRVSRLITNHNYGVISIDWMEPAPSLLLQIKAPRGGVLLEEKRILL